MHERTTTPQPPRGFSRLMWRFPIFLYKIHLGWLLGDRFLLLNHTGRVSGKPRQAVLEVIRYDEAETVYYVASGFGERSDWFRNIQEAPEVTIQVGRLHKEARAERLPLEDAEREFLDYAQRHPTALKNLASMLGYELDGSEESIRALAKVMPVVAFQPR